jgi:structural maintenance of chromosomes protein 5
MGRRIRTSEDEKENSRVGLQKVKSENMEKEVKREQLSKGKAKALFGDDEGDDEQEDLVNGNHEVNGMVDDDEDDFGSPKGRKRVRMDEEGEGHVVKEEEGYDPRMRVTTLPRDDDG